MVWTMTKAEKREEAHLKNVYKQRYGKKKKRTHRPKVIRNKWRYNSWRRKCLKRDNYECQNCGSKENLHVHHIKSVDEFPLLATRKENGETLCRECHNNVHQGLLDYYEQQEFLKSIVKGA